MKHHLSNSLSNPMPANWPLIQYDYARPDLVRENLGPTEIDLGQMIQENRQDGSLFRIRSCFAASRTGTLDIVVTWVPGGRCSSGALPRSVLAARAAGFGAPLVSNPEELDDEANGDAFGDHPSDGAGHSGLRRG